jgi:secreted trypsin-like serine protease
MGVSFRFQKMAVALAAALAAVPAQAIVGGQIGGPLEASAVMVLHDRGGVCTGSVLAPDVVLTAAHCVPAGAQIRVHYREQGQPVLLEPQNVVRHPEFRANAVQERTRSIDMALIRLRAPLSARFGSATLAASATGQTVTVAGFGLSREGDAATTGTWRSATLQVTEPFGPSRILLWAKAAPGVGACQGDSGGPVIGASGAILAVTSWSTGRSAGKCGDLTQGVLVAAQRGWIDSTLGRWSRQADWR